MRILISPEQLKCFQSHGYLILEDVITDKEISLLLISLREVGLNMPGYAMEDLFRSIPYISSLARKKGWGQIISTLIHKKPLRVKHDAFFTDIPLSVQEPLDTTTCGLLLDLEKKTGTFFQRYPPDQLHTQEEQKGYFLLVVTSDHLPETLHPLLTL